MATAGTGEKRAEIYTYEAPWLIYALGWSVSSRRPDAHRPFSRARFPRIPQTRAREDRAPKARASTRPPPPAHGSSPETSGPISTRRAMLWRSTGALARPCVSPDGRATSDAPFGVDPRRRGGVHRTCFWFCVFVGQVPSSLLPFGFPARDSRAIAPRSCYGIIVSQVRQDQRFRLAIGSFVEEYGNKVDIITLDDEAGAFPAVPQHSFTHPYPCTKILFIPDKECSKEDLVATTGDYLRVWNIKEDGVQLKSLLNNNKNSEICAPLTSFDWNETNMQRIGTSSLDTTCTIWDIEKEVVDTQLIAHDKEVYDIAWGGPEVFASVSADGSVRVFDLRDKDHSTILYESPKPDTPLLRLGWNKQNPRYMATMEMDSSKVVVLDIRFPTLPVEELQRHSAPVNTLAWAPHSSCHICTAGDDSQALIWDLSSMSQPSEGGLDPILAYGAGAEVSQLHWSSSQPDWIAIAFDKSMQILRV